MQSLAEPGPGKSNWALFWRMILLLSIGVLWEHALIERWRKQRHSGLRPTHPVVRFPPGPHARLSRRCRHPRRRSFGFLGVHFGRGGKLLSFWGECGRRFFFILLSKVVTEGGPPLVTMMYVWWVFCNGAFWEKLGQMNCKTTFSPNMLMSFWLANGLFSFSGVGGLDALHWKGQTPWAPGRLTVEFVNVGGWLTHGYGNGFLCSVPGCF